MQTHVLKLDGFSGLGGPQNGSAGGCVPEDRDHEQWTERREGPSDRRVASSGSGAFTDPRLWVSVCGVLLTLSIFVFSFMYSRFSEMLTAQQTMLVTITRQDAELSQVRRDVDKLEDAVSRIAKDQSSTETRITYLEAVNGTGAAGSSGAANGGRKSVGKPGDLE